MTDESDAMTTELSAAPFEEVRKPGAARASRPSEPLGRARDVVRMSEILPELRALVCELQPSAGLLTFGQLERSNQRSELIFCGEARRLLLPPAMGTFIGRSLNQAAYCWLAAISALVMAADGETDPYLHDLTELSLLAKAADESYRRCSRLQLSYLKLCSAQRRRRAKRQLTAHEAVVEGIILDQLNGGRGQGVIIGGPAPKSYRTYTPVVFWPRLGRSPDERALPRREELYASDRVSKASKADALLAEPSFGSSHRPFAAS